VAEKAPEQTAPTSSEQKTATAGKKGGRGKGKGKEEENPFSDSINLPQTTFTQRANAVTREPELQAFWAEQRVYERQAESNPGEVFVLHDGPPYANGELHMGHALNKILKDFINRYQSLRGRKVRYVPGWDCHGLPIELAVLKSMKSSERQQLTPLDLRRKAASFALSQVDKQRDSFKRYGVMGEWEKPYLTLDPEYEAAQIDILGKMLLKGHVYKGKKPVHWSPSSQTALAEAELEYPDGHVSKSIYASFKVTSPSDGLARLLPDGGGGGGSGGGDVGVAVWTTTPWTIPGNMAVAVNPELQYALVRRPDSDAVLIVAKDLVKEVSKALGALDELTGEGLEVLATIKGEDLVDTQYEHPLYGRVSRVVAGGDYITTDTGTGLVHTAPGHGQEDFETGQKYGLEPLSPVDNYGRFTAEAGERFEGLSVLKEGNEAIIQALDECGSLLKAEDYPHRYPYDWRTKKPTIFRATEQWFISVDAFREAALAAIDEVRWIPEMGKTRIASMTSSRSDWCISRQRSWGVPIPVFYQAHTNEPLINNSTITHIKEVFRQHGTDAWWTMDTQQLLPEPYRSEWSLWVRGNDTIDVWFDSGSSWAGVVNTRDNLRHDNPVELYLEGSDQHRGWFQSSLLTSVAVRGAPPYQTVLTHGFVLDEKGYKMSKSLGNVLSPLTIIEGGSDKKKQPAYGADVLRLWVATVDYSSDVLVGGTIIKQVFDAYRKLRNTARFLIGNIHDFDKEQDGVAYEDLPEVDKWVLGKTASLIRRVREAYESYQFYRVTQELLAFSNQLLSNFYLDVSKDRLYISTPNDRRRRACQSVIRVVTEAFALLLAPLLPHMAEDIWQNLPHDGEGVRRSGSVFEAGWPSGAEASPPFREDKWDLVMTLRDDVNKVIESARTAKLVGANSEAAVHIHCPDPQTTSWLRELLPDQSPLLATTTTTTDGRISAVDDLRFLFLTSQVHLADSPGAVEGSCPEFRLSAEQTGSGCTVGVSKAVGTKCERCWMWGEDVSEWQGSPRSQDDPPSRHSLCPRCRAAVEQFLDRRRARAEGGRTNQP